MTDAPPTTGPEAILAALQAMNLDALEQEQRDVIRSGRTTKRGRAVRLLNAVQGLRVNELKPEQLMLTSIPVIPPKFRPFSLTGDTFLPGDANEVYRDLLEYRRLYGATEKAMGREGASEAYLDLVRAAKAAYGYGESPNPKTKARAVKGFFKMVTGTNPKTSFYQQKMLSKPMDTVGRGVIIPDADYGMDDVGIPEEMAWKLYGSYVQRRLVRSGMAAPAALKHIVDRTPMARKALEDELPHRPVVVTRSPSWHKFNAVGQRPRLVEGDAIRINTYITSGMNADFDGNCIVGSVNMVVRVKGSITEGMNADTSGKHIELGVDSAGNLADAERTMKITATTNVKMAGPDYVVTEIPIRDIPVKVTPPAKDKNGADVYEVADGVQVLTNAPDQQGVRWETITHLTVEHGCNVVDLTTTSGKMVGVSSNESIPVPDGKGGLAKVTPADALGQLMPVTIGYPRGGSYGDAEWGWVVGSFLSDGWWSDGYVGYTKADDAKRSRFLKGFCRYVGFDEAAVNRYEAMHEADNNSGVGGVSKKLHFSMSGPTGDAAAYLRDQCYNRPALEKRGDGQRACLFKKMPDNLWEMSEGMLLGVLTGLFDGDGSLSVSTGKSKPQVLANVSTSSAQLRDGVIELLRMLGIRSSYSTCRPKSGRLQKHDNYVVTVSVVDLAPWVSRLALTATSPAVAMLMERGVAKDDRDIVPIPQDFVGRLVAMKPEGVSAASAAVLKSRWRKYPYVSVARRKALEWLSAYDRAGGAQDEVRAATEAYVQSSDLLWEKVESVEPRPSEPVYDVVVPTTKVFVISNGLVIFDTMSIHVPSGADAVKDVREKMMASKMLWSIKDRGTVLPSPKHEQVLGLNMSPSGKRHQFASNEEADAAIESGAVDLNDDIDITP